MGTAKGTRPQTRRLQERKTIIVSLARLHILLLYSRLIYFFEGVISVCTLA